MNDAPFKIGDLVKLKSGGPSMTVEDCDRDDCECWIVRATWFDKKKHSDALFDARSLIADFWAANDIGVLQSELDILKDKAEKFDALMTVAAANLEMKKLLAAQLQREAIA